jgi:hypothetical protein
MHAINLNCSLIFIVQINKNTTTQFTYSNGDSYIGEMSNGHPHGSGVMSYEGGEAYSGQWSEGKHHGRGDKNWGDGITYCGEWQVCVEIRGGV